jgi:hypothetical protein
MWILRLCHLSSPDIKDHPRCHQKQRKTAPKTLHWPKEPEFSREFKTISGYKFILTKKKQVESSTVHH